MHGVKLYLNACILAMAGTERLLQEGNHPEPGSNYNQNLSALRYDRVISRQRCAYPVLSTVTGHESEEVSTEDFTVPASSNYPI
jgi:hypothetical protein